MKKPNQASVNPFKNSDTNKRYYSYEYYLRKTFGGKCAKIPLDCGFGCPGGGCIYCAGGGRERRRLPPIEEQYRIGRLRLSSKWPAERCIPYLNAGTNTNAPPHVLRDLYGRALRLDGAVGLNIATRADCLSPETVELLAEISVRTVLTVELGLQTIHDTTAALIGRGHLWADFIEGYSRLRSADGNIGICVHLIFGLPGESEEMMLDSVRAVAALCPEQVKLHMLYVPRGTPLARMYESGEYIPLTRERYVGIICRALELLPPDTVICRLTGDGEGDELLAPEWSRAKVSVINDIDKKMFARGTYQGRLRGFD